jgi:hypothetical protein
LQDNNMEKGSSEVFWVTKRTLAYLPWTFVFSLFPLEIDTRSKHSYLLLFSPDLSWKWETQSEGRKNVRVITLYGVLNAFAFPINELQRWRHS